MALFAGAFDERVSLTIAQESGGGGATSWRYSHSEPSGTVEEIDNTDYNWFMDSMHQFAGDNVSYMPEDHHELMAMCAPRALYVTANPSVTWLSNPSCNVASEGCKQVYKALGIPDRFGYSIVGGHSHCAVPDSQTAEIGAFVDKFLLGKDTVNTKIADAYFNIDLSPWITWTNPVLSTDTSYFGETSLIYPPDLQQGLDTTVTFKWSKVKDAEKYFIQLSIDPAFRNIDKSDSTTTDTLKTISGLVEGKIYYWRIQVKSATGLGPWSNLSSFATTISLPAMPQLISASPYPNRPDYITLKWKQVKYADQYSIQISDSQTFTNVLASASTSDTVKNFSSISEGQKYYWRVQASNIAGSGPWSDASNFTLILAPTDLVLESSALNEITLTWNNHSTVADGYVIERKQSPQTSFTVLDTLMGSRNEYVDKKVEQAQTYTYRTRAYKGDAESDYSNEASLNLTGIKKGEEGIPTEYSISQNYPNPFNPNTVINYALPKSSLVTIKIYNILGEEVKILLHGQLQAGYYTIQWNGDNNSGHSVASGMYIYRVDAGQYVKTMKMMFLK
jgi:hypothetical protein